MNTPVFDPHYTEFFFLLIFIEDLWKIKHKSE